jgi:hypothetical protein
MADDVQIVAKLSPEGGGLPIHASMFQVVLDTSEITLIFMQKALEYQQDSPNPKFTHRIVGQVSMSHMLAKDFLKQLTRSLNDFERQYPIPEIQAPLFQPE